MADRAEQYLRQAIRLAIEAAGSDLGGPFGAVIARGTEVVATGLNLVTSTNDPSAHAEIVAIRLACQKLKSIDLSGCEMYASCEPCPMCVGALYWARVNRLYFACTRDDAAQAGFADALIYQELALSPEKRSIPGHCMLRDEGLEAFRKWLETEARVRY